MAKTRVDMIVETLRDNPERKFTARELAKEFIKRYPVEMAAKKKRSGYQNEEELIAQLAAEVGGTRTERAKKTCPNVATKDKPRPRVYYWASEQNQELKQRETTSRLAKPENVETTKQNQQHSEYSLYPLLIKFVAQEFGLYSLRIDEKTSTNSQGPRGNHWLHPDLVSMEPLDRHWETVVKDCVRHYNVPRIRLWSFEVKRSLSKSNVRESFFQAVSNSSWANYGYLVAANIANDVEPELHTLSTLHGIGVLILNIESLFDSQVIIPARERNNVDWQSVNRIAKENKDFRQFMELVGIYSQTGKLQKSLWNK